MEDRVIADDGVELWVRQAGLNAATVTVLCCHGGPGLADNLEPVERALEGSARIVRWDQRGSGRSDPVGPFTIERFVADLECVRTWAGAERVVVVGHSWGANLAMLYAQYHPERLDGIVYVSGIGLEWWPEFTAEHKRQQLVRLGPVAGARLRQLASAERTPTEDIEFRMLYIRSELHDVSDERTAARLLEAEGRYPANLDANAALNRASKALALEDQVARLRAVAHPVLIVHGSSDPRPVASLDSMISALPNVELLELEGAGHSPWIEQPERFAEAIRTFIADSGAAADEAERPRR